MVIMTPTMTTMVIMTIVSDYAAADGAEEVKHDHDGGDDDDACDDYGDGDAVELITIMLTINVMMTLAILARTRLHKSAQLLQARLAELKTSEGQAALCFPKPLCLKPRP